MTFGTYEFASANSCVLPGRESGGLNAWVRAEMAWSKAVVSMIRRRGASWRYIGDRFSGDVHLIPDLQMVAERGEISGKAGAAIEFIVA